MSVKPRPRLLWVDDDAAIRHWVAMVLEDEAIDLHLCANAAQAREQLGQGPVDLLVTDLMMPGESGFELLAAWPGPRPPRCVVFSARQDEAARQQMAALGVWRHLLKPASVAQVLDCVRSGLLLAAPAALDTPIVAEAERRERATAHSFGGDAGLFDRFEAACRAQFALDAAQGVAAAQAGDLAMLRLLGHSLKSVLRMLGHEAAALQAQALEQADGSAAAQQAWEDLHVQLLQLAR